MNENCVETLLEIQAAAERTGETRSEDQVSTKLLGLSLELAESVDDDDNHDDRFLVYV